MKVLGSSGLIQKIAGVIVFLIAFDMVVITSLGKNASATFQPGEAGTSLPVRQPPSADNSRFVFGVVMLVIAVALGFGLYAWGDADARKYRRRQLEERESKSAHSSP